MLRLKVYEPVLVAGEDAFAPIDIRVRVKGGGHTSQVYAIRQAISKALVAYYAKYFDAYSAMALKKKLVQYDRTLLIADPRRMEPKKFGGAGARARRQKRYVAQLESWMAGCLYLSQLPVKGAMHLHMFRNLCCKSYDTLCSFHGELHCETSLGQAYALLFADLAATIAARCLSLSR